MIGLIVGDRFELPRTEDDQFWFRDLTIEGNVAQGAVVAEGTLAPRVD